MTKSLRNLWGRFLFRDRGIIPTKRLMLLFLILSVFLLIGTGGGISWGYIIAVNIAVFIISLVDLIFSPKKNQLFFKRKLAAEMERGIPYAVEIEVRNDSPYSISYRLMDGLPQSFEHAFPIVGKVYGGSTTTLTYDTSASVRGKYKITKLYCRYKSFLGLWEKQFAARLTCSIKVIPDLTETKEYLENAQQFLMYEGSKIRRQRIGSSDFSKIRSYVVGDDPRKINWRQSAKLQEIMTNVYEPEHGKYITILIDCGRMMGAELKKGNRLERVIEASLTVAAAALKKGDYVSILAFSKKINVYVPPAKGIDHLQTVLQAIYDLKVDAAESNYGAVFQYLETVQKKRSLLLLFSDVRTFLHEENTFVFFKRLRKRHLFLMVGMEDETLLKRIAEEPVDIQAAMIKSMAQQQMLAKKREKLKWEKQGLLMVEAREENLAITAVSHYIDIMNQNLL